MIGEVVAKNILEEIFVRKRGDMKVPSFK